MFAANVPQLERLLRLLLGLAVATGLVGFCPACALPGRRLTPRR